MNTDDWLEMLLWQMQGWMDTPNWEASSKYLLTHSALLTEAAEHGLKLLIEREQDAYQRCLIAFHQDLLQQVRLHGLERAYVRLVTTQSSAEKELLFRLQDWIDTPNEIVLSQMQDWMDMPDREHSEAYLAAHTTLLTVQMQQLLEVFWRAAPNGSVRASFDLHRQLLATARVQSVSDAYRQFFGEHHPQAERGIPFPAAIQAMVRRAMEAKERYQEHQEKSALEEVIVAWQEVMGHASFSMLPEELQSEVFNQAGASAFLRYEALGTIKDLGQTLTYWQEALQLTPADDPTRPAHLNNIGLALFTHYEHTGILTDLEQALAYWQEVLQLTPADAPIRSRALSNLSLGLRGRYRRTGALADLEQAIAADQEALQLTPAGGPARSVNLNNLGAVLLTRYERTGALADLEQALTYWQEALHLTPVGAPARPSRLNNLGTVLRLRHENTGALADLEQAIAVGQEALQLTPVNTPDRPARLTNLGTGLYARYEHTGALADLEQALVYWQEAWSRQKGTFATLSVLYQLGRRHLEGQLSALLVDAYFEHARHVRGSARADRCRALTVVEGNKSRLLTQLIGRGDLHPPAGLSPHLVANERRVLAALTSLDTQELVAHDHKSLPQQEPEQRNRLAERQTYLHELAQLWTEIEAQSAEAVAYVALRRGDLPSWEELTSWATQFGRETALASLSITATQTRLFLLRAGWRCPQVFQLSLSGARWIDLLDRFAREVSFSSGRARLDETWDRALKPLLEQTTPYLQGIERLIFVPDGVGHLLPWSILAQRADWYTSTGQLLPLVLLPALGVLPRLRRRSRHLIGPTLVIGDPQENLPFAAEEARLVGQFLNTVPLLGMQASKVALLARLPEASLVHLAVHAAFEPNSPLEARVELADGWLTAREVLELRLQADFLVLSACETGRGSSLGGQELTGLAQAFLQAGVRSLLVSLWPVDDAATATLMLAFYEARRAGADKASALRQAMSQIQQYERWRHPYYWGAFTLMGDWE